jgi:hypothetical protein
MSRHRGAGRTKIKTVVGNPEVKINMVAQIKPMGVRERVLDRGLISKTPVAMQIALENVAGLKLDEIERDPRFLLGGGNLLEGRFRSVSLGKDREGKEGEE